MSKANKHMLQIGELIRTQSDSHMTANPLYVVYEVERIYTDHNPTDYEWFNEATQATATDDEHAKLEAEYDEFSEEKPEGWIRMDGHNLVKPHIYVHGLFRNEEMLAIRSWLMSLPAETETDLQKTGVCS